jgi:hypothetical protein
MISNMVYALLGFVIFITNCIILVALLAGLVIATRWLLSWL